MLSYDHYQFTAEGDAELYFLNLAIVREQHNAAGVPFLNIVQAASWPWDPAMRVPTGDEMRYLVYTTLAYGAQGISYYVYCYPGHTGGIVLPDGTPTPIYHALKSLNREFVAIATELQPLASLGTYHAGMTPPGTSPWHRMSAFRLAPPIAAIPCENPTSGNVPSSNNGRVMKPVKGMLLGFFGPDGRGRRTCSVRRTCPRRQSGLRVRDCYDSDRAREAGGLRRCHPHVVTPRGESGQAVPAAGGRQAGANPCDGAEYPGLRREARFAPGFF